MVSERGGNDRVGEVKRRRKIEREIKGESDGEDRKSKTEREK